MNEESMGIRELARFIGVSDNTVRKAITSKKIPETCINRSNPNRPEIYVKRALEAWGKKFTPGTVQSKPLRDKLKGPRPEKEPEPAIKQKPIIDLSDLVEGEEIIISNSAEFEEAKRVEAITKARSAQLELAKAKGKLVERTKVDNELFDLGVIIRTSLQGIPDKHIDNIRAAGTRQEAHSIMYKAITESLEALQPKK